MRNGGDQRLSRAGREGAAATIADSMGSGLRIVRYYPRAATGDGGMTGAVTRWSRAHAALGANVTIVHDGGSPPADTGGVEWISLPHRGRGRARIPVDLSPVLRRADVLVIHSGWTAQGARAAAIARDVGTPYILEPRGAYDPHIVARRRITKQLWWRIAEQELVHGAAAIHVFYEEERSALEALGYRGAIVVVPNGAAADEEIRWTGGGGYLLFLGRFDVQHKGLDLLLEGVASLPARERPVVRLHGSDHGEGGRRALRNLVNRYGLETWIRVGEHILGRDRRRALAECDGFLYPSRWDACPNAVLEAVGLGIPTLATPYPLARDLADRGALIMVSATAAGIAEGLRELANDSVRQAVTARGPDVISRWYAWERIGRSWLEQVEDMLERRATTPAPPEPADA